MRQIYNFSAGPSILPEPVLQEMGIIQLSPR
jgi:phosphoserine aminotransferase